MTNAEKNILIDYRNTELTLLGIEPKVYYLIEKWMLLNGKYKYIQSSNEMKYIPECPESVFMLTFGGFNRETLKNCVSELMREQLIKYKMEKEPQKYWKYMFLPRTKIVNLKEEEVDEWNF